MRILVLNCGSSSLKYRVIDMPGDRELAAGEAQRIGPRTSEPSRLVHRSDGRTDITEVPMPDHGSAFARIMETLRATRIEPDAVGHRVVHGGTRFVAPTRITAEVLQRLLGVEHLAPIHNPPAFRLIEAIFNQDPDLVQVAVFDTSYHSTIPRYARTYALPARLRTRMGFRKYGFHGTSHRFVAGEAARMLGIPLDQLNAVSCHLGSGGASLCAIVRGRSVDNTMGYSPLQGLIMSTRCGDLDPAAVLQLIARATGDAAGVEAQLNRKSGVLGMSELSSDIRDVLAASADPARRTPQLAAVAEAYLWRLRKYLGAYLALVRSPQAVIFTDSIGEGVACVRQAVCANMEAFGVGIDPERNASADALPVDVATDRSPVRVLVIATNEELAIAREVHRALSAPESAAGKPPDGDARKRGGVANERRQRRNTSLTHAPRRIR